MSRYSTSRPLIPGLALVGLVTALHAPTPALAIDDPVAQWRASVRALVNTKGLSAFRRDGMLAVAERFLRQVDFKTLERFEGYNGPPGVTFEGTSRDGDRQVRLQVTSNAVLLSGGEPGNETQIGLGVIRDGHKGTGNVVAAIHQHGSVYAGRARNLTLTSLSGRADADGSKGPKHLSIAGKKMASSDARYWLPYAFSSLASANLKQQNLQEYKRFLHDMHLGFEGYREHMPKALQCDAPNSQQRAAQREAWLKGQ